MIEHTTRAFDSDLHELARKIAEMGRLDGEQIADAIDGLFPRTSRPLGAYSEGSPSRSNRDG